MTAEQTSQALFAEISSRLGVLTVKFVGPSIGQREATIVTEMAAEALAQIGKLRYITLDFTNITFMNSMGLGMCIDLRNRAAKLGAKPIISGMNQQLADLFKMVKVDRLFTIVKSPAELAKLTAG